MAEGLDRSFSLEELEINEIEERASVPNFENLTTCSCRSNCIRERSMHKLLPMQKSRPILCKCLPYCHDGNSLCLNNRRALENNSDDSSVSFLRLLGWYANKMYKTQSSTNCTIIQIST